MSYVHVQIDKWLLRQIRVCKIFLKPKKCVTFKVRFIPITRCMSNRDFLVLKIHKGEGVRIGTNKSTTMWQCFALCSSKT